MFSGSLADRLCADGWIPGRPKELTPGAHVCLAFSSAEDFHFYRLGPDGWSHKTGDEAAEQVADPFSDAARRGYTNFDGWWTVPHSTSSNRPRSRLRDMEHELLHLFGDEPPAE